MTGCFRSVTTTSLLLLGLLAVSLGSPRTSAAAVPRGPQLSFTETGSVRPKCVRDPKLGEVFCEDIQSGTLSVTAAATLDRAVDIAAFDASTPVSIQLGALLYDGVLGDDPRYRPGRTSATFFIREDDGKGHIRMLMTVTVRWPNRKLSITVRTTALSGISAVIFEVLGSEPGRVTGSVEGGYSLGDSQFNFTVNYQGQLTNREANAADHQPHLMQTASVRGTGVLAP